MSGLTDVVRFNRGAYSNAALTIGLMLILRRVRLLARGRPLIDAVGGVTAYFSLSSLLATYLVYDRSGVFRWQWISHELPDRPTRWLNIHTGLDQSTPALRALFAGSWGRSVDIFDAETMTEESIAVARADADDRREIVIARPESLPVADGSIDAVFALFSAHEIRNATQRQAFFAEIARVLRPGGQLLLTEHIRDWRNGAAYGPGCMHFWPAREWRRLGAGAGLTLDRETTRAWLIRTFLFFKPS